MREFEIKISNEYRTPEFTHAFVSIDGENKQDKLIFYFDNTFVDGRGRLEIELPSGDKEFIELDKNDDYYSTPVKNIITKEGILRCQLVVAETSEEEVKPIFKSTVFMLRIEPSINALAEAPDEYNTWLEEAYNVTQRMNQETDKLENINLTAEKIGINLVITITNKDGEERLFTVSDGRGIEKIEKTGTEGLVDYYTITYTDGEFYVFTVTNGRDLDPDKYVYRTEFENLTTILPWNTVNGNTNTTITINDTSSFLESTLNVYGKTEDIETSPDNPHELNSVGIKNYLELRDCEFTLHDVEFKVSNGYLYINGNASFETSSTSLEYQQNFDFYLDAGTYYFKKPSDQTPTYIHKFDDDNTVVVVNEGYFTLTERTHLYYGIYIYQHEYNDYFSYAYINKDSNYGYSARDKYSIIVNSSVHGIPYPNTYINFDEPIRSIEDTMDEIRLENTKIRTTRKIGKIVFNGTENWITDYSGDSLSDGVYGAKIQLPLSESYTHFAFGDLGITCLKSNLFTQKKIYHTRVEGIDIGWGRDLYVKINASRLGNPETGSIALTRFKEWLNNNNLEVTYILEEETEEEIGTSDIIKTFSHMTDLLVSTNLTTNYYFNYKRDLEMFIRNETEGLIIRSDDDTTISGKTLPNLTMNNIVKAFNGIIQGKHTIIADSTGDHYYNITNVYFENEEAHIIILYKDNMFVDYSTSGTITYKEIATKEDINNNHLVIRATSNTTVNGYQVPSLTSAQITEVYNALVLGKNIVLSDANNTMHFSVTQADNINSEIYIIVDYFDVMRLEYNQNGTISFKEFSSGGGGGGTDRSIKLTGEYIFFKNYSTSYDRFNTTDLTNLQTYINDNFDGTNIDNLLPLDFINKYPRSYSDCSRLIITDVKYAGYQIDFKGFIYNCSENLSYNYSMYSKCYDVNIFATCSGEPGNITLGLVGYRCRPREINPSNIEGYIVNGATQVLKNINGTLKWVTE